MLHFIFKACNRYGLMKRVSFDERLIFIALLQFTTYVQIE